MTELSLHVVCKNLEPFFVFESHLLLHQVLFVTELAAQPCLFVFKHLSEALFNKIAIIGKFFFPFVSHILMLAGWTKNNSPLLLLEGTWGSRALRRPRLLSTMNVTTSSYVAITMDLFNRLC